MSWEKWDAEHRSAGVRETKMSSISTKVTSGGKHLGNIHKESNGTHTAVTKVGGALQSHNFQSHQGALNHIRKTHGLSGVSAKKTAPSVAAKKTAAAPQSAATARDAMHAAPPAKKTAAPFHAWNAEHGSGEGGVSSADKIAASIRGALGPGKMGAPKVESKTGKSGSTISRAAESRSTASHVLKKDMKRPAPVKGEKDAADAFRTKIRMAAYNEKKKAAAAADPVNQHTSHTEEKLNPHVNEFTKAHDKALAASATAKDLNSYSSHMVAAAYHSAAAKLATNSSDKEIHQYGVNHHQAMADKAKAGKTAAPAPGSSAAKIAASIKGVHAAQHPPKATPIAKKSTSDLADEASKKAFANPTLTNHQAALVLHNKALASASFNSDTTLSKYHKQAIQEHKAAVNKLQDEMEAKIEASNAAKKVAAAPTAPKAAHTVPALVEQKHAAGSSEDLANKADAATHLANADPSYVNHQKAYEAHTAALSKLGSTSHSGSDQYKARDYHTMMQGYHRFAADNPSKVIPAGIKEEHKDKLAERMPQASPHQMFTSFTESGSRRHSQQLYSALPKASDAKLTAAQKSSIGAYSGSGYTTINAYHRNPGSSSETNKAYAEKHSANIDAAFRKQPVLAHDLVTYRGTRNADKLFGKVGEKVGGEFVDHGYTSTASHAAVGGSFGGGMAGANTGTLVRILHPQGSRVMKLSDVGSFGDSEREILTPRGTRFHIAADRLVTLQNGRTQRQIDLIRK